MSEALALLWVPCNGLIFKCDSKSGRGDAIR
jgi:hypothetical protein